MNRTKPFPPMTSRAYGSKPIRQRALVILAGPLSHVLVGGLLYFTLFVTYGDTNTELVVVGEVAPTLDGSSSPALEAGLQVGDVVTRVGDLEAPTPDSLGRYVTRYAEDHPGEPLAYVIERDGRSSPRDRPPSRHGGRGHEGTDRVHARRRGPVDPRVGGGVGGVGGESRVEQRDDHPEGLHGGRRSHVSVLFTDELDAMTTSRAWWASVGRSAAPASVGTGHCS